MPAAKWLPEHPLPPFVRWGFFMSIGTIAHTGFDMDPPVDISFAKKAFRTRVLRHVEPRLGRKSRKDSYSTSVVAGRNCISSLFDVLGPGQVFFVGDANFEISSLIETAQAHPDPTTRTRLYALDCRKWDHSMNEMPPLDDVWL